MGQRGAAWGSWPSLDGRAHNCPANTAVRKLKCSQPVRGVGKGAALLEEKVGAEAQEQFNAPVQGLLCLG